ncbi:hypothetical protein C8R46DRAFT_1346611 [Mycena filopes]|nr:hypothetical protein C8R46DRAFT_1346611 [Mycena filopes]
MGIPYSRQINAAFDQVTPLVAEGFKVLQATRNISIVLAVIQVLTVVLLFQILILLLALLITLHPDLEQERDALVTPTLRWGTRSFMRVSRYSGGLLPVLAVFVVIIGIVVGGAGGLRAAAKHVSVIVDSEDAEEADEGEGKAKDGKDVGASKEGKASKEAKAK